MEAGFGGLKQEEYVGNYAELIHQGSILFYGSFKRNKDQSSSNYQLEALTITLPVALNDSRVCLCQEEHGFSTNRNGGGS
jgi:hypothetical protein